MLQKIADFFSIIGDFFLSIGQFIADFFGDLVYVVKMLGDLLPELPNFFNWLPGTVLSIFTPLLAIIVIYKILGRT